MRLYSPDWVESYSGQTAIAFKSTINFREPAWKGTKLNLVFVSLTVKRIWEQTAQKVKYMPDNQLLLPIPTTVTDFVILTPPLHDLLQLLQEPQLAQDAAIGPGYQIETLSQRHKRTEASLFLATRFQSSTNRVSSIRQQKQKLQQASKPWSNFSWVWFGRGWAFFCLLKTSKNAMKYMIFSFKKKGDVILDHFLVLWFQKDFLDTVGFRTFRGGSGSPEYNRGFWWSKVTFRVRNVPRGEGRGGGGSPV